MMVTRVRLTNARAVEAAEFTFKPGFNLIVGLNGAGKSTLLDALCVCLGQVVQHVVRASLSAVEMDEDDVRAGARGMTLEVAGEFNSAPFEYIYQVSRKTSPKDKPEERRQFVGNSPPRADGVEIERPVAVLFATRRTVPSSEAVSPEKAAGNHVVAYVQALAQRELRLREFADWMRARAALAAEQPGAARVLDPLQRAVERFLPGYSNLRVSPDGDRRELVIDRAGASIQARRLSDGERGALALVLDLTRRLAQANPGHDDPAATGTGVVLIDEIDLHLHPRWQREIVAKLTDTFPNCQFIATTHSPQVIGEVPADRIQIIADGKVYSPTHSFGVDSSRVLEEIMDASPRSWEVQDLLERLAKTVADSNLKTASDLVDKIESRLGENDPEVIRARTLLDFLGGED